jgi:hypothetical protein
MDSRTTELCRMSRSIVRFHRIRPRRVTRIAMLAAGLGLLGLVQPVMATTQAPALASPVAASAVATAARLVADLAARPQPATRFGHLAPADQRAVMRYLSVASTATTKKLSSRGAPRGLRAMKPAVVAPGAGCWAWKWERDAYNAFGIRLWAYFQEIDWCDDGITLTRDPQLLNYGSTYLPFWSWVHVGDRTWGGAGQATFRSWSQADFSLCLTPNVGCIQNTYPWLDMTARANGTGTGSIG